MRISKVHLKDSNDWYEFVYQFRESRYYETGERMMEGRSINPSILSPTKFPCGLVYTTRYNEGRFEINYLFV